VPYVGLEHATKKWRYLFPRMSKADKTFGYSIQDLGEANDGSIHSITKNKILTIGFLNNNICSDYIDFNFFKDSLKHFAESDISRNFDLFIVLWNKYFSETNNQPYTFPLQEENNIRFVLLKNATFTPKPVFAYAINSIYQYKEIRDALIDFPSNFLGSSGTVSGIDYLQFEDYNIIFTNGVPKLQFK